MQQKNEQIKNSVAYPIEEIQSFINHPRMRKYFTSTIAYMIALAIMKGYQEIEMYGVHMASTDEEYSMQRSCVETLLAFGWGREVNFYLPDESDIMKSSYLYGYQQEKGFLLKAINLRNSLKNGENNLEQKLKKVEEEYWEQKGGRKALDYFVNELKKNGV